MAYKETTLMDIYEIIRRWVSGQSISHIASVLEYDRKTVRNYINFAIEKGIRQNDKLYPKEKVLEILKSFIKSNRRQQPAREILLDFKDEIIELINNPHNPLKAKSAFEVICIKHQMEDTVSYSTFKRFFNLHCRDKAIKYNTINQITCRIETPAGRIVQIDYAKVGLIYDEEQSRRRTLYAFIATLSYCRHKFVEFVFKQDQTSFVSSNIKMVHSFGGSPEIFYIDNLKSGVIKADLYDPKLNRLYSEFAEYYDVFIDPCRVRSPKDKGKVERDVQTIREQFRKFMAINPNLKIADANRLIAEWIRDEYGQKEHGTTGLKPYETFLQNEKPKLKMLPFNTFELAEWKRAKVHPDCFVQYSKQYYSVPYQYSGKRVWIKATLKIVSIYYNDEIIKQHLRSENKRHTDLNDFPENIKASLNPHLHERLIEKAGQVGRYFKIMVQRTLNVHAWMRLRRAQGFVSLKDNYSYKLLEKGAKYIVEKKIETTPKEFKRLLCSLEEYENNDGISVGNVTKDYLRNPNYFNQNSQAQGD